MSFTVRLIKPLKGVTVRYEAELLRRDANSVTVRAHWPYATLDLGLLRFEPGDIFVESYFSDRWYNVFAVHTPAGRLKGWYCNVTRPALIGDDCVDSEDLELDLIVAPDHSAMRLDDEDEFAARNLEQDDPAAYAAALAAVEELRMLVARGEGPFADEEGR